MGLKDFYYQIEDKWYEIIDKISEKIPINKLTDAIDKYVPSFMVFIALIIIVILGLILAFAGTGLGEEKDLSFKIVNEDRQGLSQVEVVASFNEKTETLKTDAFGKTKKIQVPLNSMVTFTIEEIGFQKTTDSFKFTEEGEKKVILKKAGIDEPEGTKRIIKLYNKDSRELITGKAYTVNFYCSNSDATPPASIVITDGTGEVTEPADCGELTANVSGDFSESVTAELSHQTNEIYLEELIGEKNKLTVEVEDKDGEALDEIKVNVYALYQNNPTPSYIDTSYTFYGEAEFELDTGEYQIVAMDEGEEYYQESKEIYLSADKRITIVLTKIPVDPDEIPEEAGSLTIRVIDEDTELEIKDTKVTLYYLGEDIVFEERITDKNGEARFYSEDKELLFDATIEHELYIVKRITEILIDDSTRTIGLEKFTGQAGELKVRAVTVEGEKQKPVRNAKVALYIVEDDEITLSGITEKTTDFNGYVEFTRITNRTYKAFAYKGVSSGWSDAVLYDVQQAEDTELTVAMIIPDGTIKLTVLDQDEKAIPFAKVTFYEEGLLKELKADKTDGNGFISFTTRGDKKVYFKIEKEDFLDYHSKSYEIFGAVEIEETIQMTPVERAEKPEVKLIGLFKEGEELLDVSSLDPGEEYTAKIQLTIPENKSYTEAGIHFRTGTDIFMENDYVFLKQVNAPNALLIKYTMFDPNNLNDSKKSQTQGDAKWFNAVWRNPEPGIYTVETTIKVKDSAFPGEELKLLFRAWGKERGRIDRDPVDASVSTATDLLAQTKEKTYSIGFIGSEIFCSDEFCFSASILDLEDDIRSSTSKIYPAKILQKYRLQFTVLNNNKERKHYNARIQLKNTSEMLEFEDYEIKNADAVTVKGKADASKTQWFDLGDFDPNTTIRGTADFTITETKTGNILIQIVSNQEIVFEKEIELEVLAPKLFRIEFEPERITAGTTNQIEVTVFNEETELEVEGAQIKILDRFKDAISGPVLTDKLGKAVLGISAQAPSTKLSFRIQRKEYQTLEQEFFIDGNIIEVIPKQIGITLNTQTKKSDTFVLKVKNLLDFDLELSSIKFTGNFRDLLDEEAMNAWMYTNYGNITIPANTTKEIEVKAIASNYVIERAERDTVDLDLELEVSNSEATWNEKIPAKISIGIGGEVDDPNCLTVERKEWKTNTEGTEVKIDFAIENSCTIQGEPIELQDLEAKVVWQSNHIGKYTLTFENNPIELRSAYYRKLTDLMENRSAVATLAFQPFGGTDGTAIADIIVRARNELDGKDEFLEDLVHTEIKSLNMIDCIELSDTELKIQTGQTSLFKVITNECGDNVRFTFNSDLKLSKESVTLGSKDSEEITVDSAGFSPGRYLISVDAKSGATQMKFQVSNVFVTVYDDSCIQLSRYEFDIFDDPENEYDGYDTAQLFNYCDEKTIDITIDMQDWSLAMKESLLPAVIAFGLSAASQKPGDEEIDPADIHIPKSAGDEEIEDEVKFNTRTELEEIKEPTYVDDIADPKVYTAPKETTPTTGLFLGLPAIGPISQMLGLNNLLGNLLGGTNPFAMFGFTFVAATLYNYLDSDKVEFVSVVDRITIDDVKLLDGIKFTTEKVEVQDKDISLFLDGPFNCYDAVTDATIDCWDITFKNEKGIIQKDEQKPIMKILKTESTEHFWRKDYDLDYFDKRHGFFDRMLNGADLDFDKALEEKTGEQEEINQYHRLQFNSWEEKESSTVQNAYTKCGIKNLSGVTMQGNTGKDARPRIELDWKWSSIPINACDESNENYIYCDATQFSIEILQKVIELTDKLKTAQLVCETETCSTVNLGELIEATEKEGTVAEKERIKELVNFNAYLIKDGYSKDFQKDFHDYAVNTSFFDAPVEYYNEIEDTGIGVYFKDDSLFEFDYAGAPNQPLTHPGMYRIEIEITYNDDSWELFADGEANAKIKIKMDKLRTAEPNSPFYYLPFNGEIGIDSENGRIGYGLDYVNLEGEPVRINDGTGSIRTVPIAVADPVEVLKTSYKTDFKNSNIDQRAKIMEFQRTNSGTKLIYTPSIATPVLLEITRPKENPAETAYVFYTITADGQAQNTGSSGINNWSGIQGECRDFEDKSSLIYMETPDLHGLSQDAAYGLIGTEKSTAYGWVWKYPVRTGKFWLESIIFSPLNSEARMHLMSTSNSAKISTPNQAAVLTQTSTSSQFVELNGVTNKQITSLQKILDLVETGNVCISGVGNSSYATFFWNPEKIITDLDSKKAEINPKENCIRD